jgi:VIT1/CCC1 family predicted Fe2+/Mn2+ transporter
MVSLRVKNLLEHFQKKEVTEFAIYQKLAERTTTANADILRQIGDDELRHSRVLSKYTDRTFHANPIQVFIYTTLCTIFGLTFTLKLMEGGEDRAQDAYQAITNELPEVETLFRDEKKHENLLINMINERRLTYIGSIVQGLNDALIGLMGQIAGLSFAFQNTRLVGFAGLIAGIAQFLSTSASELDIYFTEKTEENKQNVIDSLMSGIVYLFTVICIVLPFFFFTNPYTAVVIAMLAIGIIIGAFMFYISVVRELSISKMLPPMVAMTFGISILSYGIGWIAQQILNIS